MKPLKVFFKLLEFVYSPSVAAPRSKPAQPSRCLLLQHMWPLMQTLPNKHTNTHMRRHIPDIDMVCFPSLITYRVCCWRYALNVNGSVWGTLTSTASPRSVSESAARLTQRVSIKPFLEGIDIDIPEPFVSVTPTSHLLINGFAGNWPVRHKVNSLYMQ